jgi:Bacterial regulatory helix-turn-helix protein, lysR family
MELRHLRYFIAVAEAGSLTVAAEKKLHTAQPSLSRQIRDLEYEVGVQLMSRSVHGIELTAAAAPSSTMHGWRLLRRKRLRRQRGEPRNLSNRLSPWAS